MNRRKRLVCLLLAVSAGLVQGSAAGARRGWPERFDIASKPIETPHIQWARPLPGGPIRALCLVPIHYQRDVIELAQRLDMQYDLVAFQYAVMDKAASRNCHDCLKRTTYDVILLSKVPTGGLPAETQGLMMDAVGKGTGIVSVDTRASLRTGAALNPKGSGASIETALPLHLLPPSCRPTLKVGTHGQGRCVAMAYPGRSTGFTPEVKFEQVHYRDWECYFQLLCRAVLWAAKRDSGVRITSVWPSALSQERTLDQWHTKRLRRTTRPSLLRPNGRWKLAISDETLPLATWRGFGARVEIKSGKLSVAETHLTRDRGFGAGTFDVDLGRAPLLEVTVAEAKEWALFVPDLRFRRALAVLQPRTSDRGVRRYDLRKFGALRGRDRLTFCFSAIGEGSRLVLDSMRLLAPDGKPIAEAKTTTAVPKTPAIYLRLLSRSDQEVTVTAAYHGKDYYELVETRKQRVSLKKGRETEVQFPVLNLCAGAHHAVDLIVRDEQGRSLAFATASYEVVAPVGLASLETEKEFYRRGEDAMVVAAIENKAEHREAALTLSLTDMHGRLIASADKKIRIPAGESKQRLSLPTANSLTTLNRARLSIRDAKGLLLEQDVYVYLPEAKPAWDDFLVSTSHFSFRNAYLRPYVMRVASDIGIEGLVVPPRYSIEVLRDATPVMYWLVAKVHAFGYNFRATETSTARKPCLSDPETRKKVSAAYEESGKALRRYGPLAIASLEDESELSGARYGNLEVCTGEHCTRRYHDWLKGNYKTIEALNQEWGTAHRSWDQISQITYKEARKLANPAQWVDWRTFMEDVWIDGLLLTRKGVKKHYPEVRMGFSNTFGQMPFSGWDYEKVSRHVDMSIEYPTIIDRLRAPRDADAFEEDAVDMTRVVRQKVDIRRSFMPAECPIPGWIWYDRSRQGAEFRPWWMAFMGAKGCTPWGACSLGVRSGARRMSFWAFIHPSLAHTRSSKWFAAGVRDLTRGVGKVFVDYERVVSPIAVLYSQPSVHVAWVRSDSERAFRPKTTSLYAWYFKSRVNVTRMLRELGHSYRYVACSQIAAGDLANYRALFLPCSLALRDDVVAAVEKFVRNGGVVVADVGAGATDEHGKPVPRQDALEKAFGISRKEVCKEVEPTALKITSGAVGFEIPHGLKLAGRDAIAARAPAAATYPDGAPAIVVNRVGKGRAVYLNGFLGYNLPSRVLMRNILTAAGLPVPIRITSGGREHMGYESARFRKGPIEIVGILRLRQEDGPTQVSLGRTSHLYNVRSKQYLGRTDRASLDLTEKAAAVLAMLPYEIAGVEAKAEPAKVNAGDKVGLQARVLATGAPGDHVLRMEVYDPSNRLSRAYSDNVLARGGTWQRRLHTALNEQPGRWRVLIRDVISGKTVETFFQVR